MWCGERSTLSFVRNCEAHRNRLCTWSCARRLSPSAAAKRKLAEANAQIAELKVSVDGLEKERDFYFGKLRDIEILLQSCVPNHVAPCWAVLRR